MKQYLMEVQGISLELFDSEGMGDPVLMVHGNSSSAHTYQPLLESPLANRFRLVAVNLPGHGGSELMAHISTPALADLLVELISTLKLDHYFAIGHSIGGHALSHALPQMTGCKGLILVSAPPLSLPVFADAFKPDPVEGALFTAALTEAQVTAMADALLGPQKSNSEDYRMLLSTIRKTDGAFRSGLGGSLAQGQFADEQKNILDSDCPVALVWGTEDGFINPDFYKTVSLPHKFGEGFYPFAGAGHIPQLADSARMVALVTKLLEEHSVEAKACA